MANIPSGTDIASLGVAVDVTQPAAATPVLDEMAKAGGRAADSFDNLEVSSKKTSATISQVGTQTTIAAKSVVDLSEAVSKNAKNQVYATDVMAGANEVIKNKIQLLTEQWKAEQVVAKQQVDNALAMERETIAGQAFVVKLEEMVATYGKNREAMLRYKADMLGVSEAASPLIEQLELMNAATQKYGVTITEVSQIEAARIEYETNALTVFNAFKNRTMAENRAAAIADINVQEAARIEAIEREESRLIVFNAFKNRMMAENRAAAIELMNEQELAAVTLAEKQAIEEISWNAKSVRARIAELEKLQLYQASSAIRPETVASTFSSAAISDLPNLGKLVEAQTAIDESAKKVAKSHDEMGVSFSNNRARTEALVVAHEALQGRYTRIPGSLMVMAEYTNAASLAFTGMGIVTLGLVGTLAVFGYEMIKGVSELSEFNKAMELTGGYSGQTRASIEAMAESLKGSAHGAIGTTTDMLMALVASGKFTADSLYSVSRAALDFQALTGKSTEEVSKYFEGMVKVHGKVFNEMTNTTADWAAKANESYHFLSASQYEYIRVLALQGQQEEAQIEIANRMHESMKYQDEQIGILVASYRGWVMMLQDAAHWMKELGKDWFSPATKAAEITAAATHLRELIHLKDEAQNGRVLPNGITTMPDKDAFAKYQKEVNDQQDALMRLQKEYQSQTASTKKKADDAKIDEDGVFGQRELDSIKNANRLKDDVAADYINRYLQAVTFSNKSRINEWEKSYKGDQEGYDAAMKLAMDNGTLKIETEKDVAIEIEKIKKNHHNAVAHIENDGYNVRLQEALQHADADYKLVQDATNANEKLIKSAMSAHVLAEQVGYATLRQNRADELESLKLWAKTRNDILDAYVGKKKLDNAHADKYRTITSDQFDNKKNDITSASNQNDQDQVDKEAKAYDKLKASIESKSNKVLESLDREIAKQREHNAEIGKTKEQIEIARAAQDEAAAATNKREADAITLVLANAEIRKAMTVNDVEFYTARLAFLDRVIGKQKELSDVHVQGATNEANSPETLSKAADKLAQQWKTAGDTIGKSLSDGMGKGAKSAGDLFKAFATGQAKQILLAKELAKSQADAVGTKDEEKRNAEALDKFNAESARGRMTEYADIASSAAGFFNEQSKGYKALSAVSQVFHAAELAMTVAELVPKAISAVLTQGTGDPYSAFARIATMTAIVAGLGVIIGGGGGSGGASAVDVQKTQGTGTVFGDSSAKSDSISKSIELLTKNSGDLIPLNQGMLASLQSIDAAMTGLTNLVVRIPGLSSGTNLGIQTGMLSGGDAVTNAVASIGEKVFGTNNVLGTLSRTLSNLFTNVKQTIVDSGLQFGGSVNDLSHGQGVNQYASVDTTKSSLFGLIKNTSNSVQTQGLSSDVSSQFGLIFTNLQDYLKKAAIGVGENTTAVEKALDSLSIPMTSISLKGLTGDALSSAINGVISSVMDTISESAFPEFEKFRQVGEGYTQTVTRIVNDYATVDAGLNKLSLTFGATGISSIDARENLISLLGGIDGFSKTTSDFSTNFLTKAQQLAPVQKYVTDQLTAMGLAGVTTREQLASVVEGLDLSTQADRDRFASIMNLESAFAAVTPVIKDLTKSAQDIADEHKTLQDQYDQLTMTSTELLKKQRDALDETNRPLFDQIQLEQAKKDAIEATTKATADALADYTSVLDIQGQIFAITGDKAGQAAVLEAQHVAALKLLTPNVAAATKALWDAQAAAKATADALAESNTLLDLQSQLYGVLGDKAGQAAILQKQHAAALLLLTPAVAKATKALWDAQDAATALANVKSQASDLLGNVDASFGVLQKLVNAQKDALTKAHDAQIKAIQVNIDGQQKLLDSAKSLSDLLHSTLDGMQQVGQEANDRAAAQAQIKTALAIAKAGGPLPNSDDLKKSLGIVAQDASAQFATYQDYQRDFYQTQNDIGSLADYSDKAVSVAQQTLDTLNAQKDASDAFYASETARLDLIVSTAQQQIDVLKGIDVTALSIEQAIQALGLSIAKAQTNPIVNSTGAITKAYETSLGRAPDAAGLAFWQGQAANGQSISNITDSIANSTEATLDKLYESVLGRAPDPAGLAFWMNAYGPTIDTSEQNDFIKAAQPELKAKADGTLDQFMKANGVPSFDIGTASVPNDMLAFVHKDEAIIPAADNRKLLARLSSPAANNNVLVQAVKELQAEVVELRRVNSLENYNMVKHLLTMADIDEKQEAIGMPPVRTT